jgi:beta-glucosidase/6-phospho-beta-glucosidase/beta-galactosidase
MTSVLPLSSKDFHWATGIEDTFIPHVRPGFRQLDEYKLTQHYELWKSDLDLVAGLGVKFLRWGLPWYRVQPKPEVFDWSWTDLVLDTMVNVKGITPILDLVHYGAPLWMDNSFINASYPQYAAGYAYAVAERYRSLSPAYTPLNEPSVNAEMCGEKGIWPPYLTGEDGYMKIMGAVARGIVLTVQAIRQAHPAAPIVHVEALWHKWTEDPSPAIRRQVELNHLKQYLCTDLCLGRLDEDHPLFQTLVKNGFTQYDLGWFRDQAVEFDIFGANFYPWSYGEVKQRQDGAFYRLRRHVHGSAIKKVILDVWNRYRIPVMVTETSAKGSHAQRGRWMDETISAVHALRREGVPVAGYTWFPMFTMFDWKYRTGRRPLSAYTINLGLFDCDFDQGGVYCRIPTPLVDRYREHIRHPVPALPVAPP